MIWVGNMGAIIFCGTVFMPNFNVRLETPWHVTMENVCVCLCMSCDWYCDCDWPVIGRC